MCTDEHRWSACADGRLRLEQGVLGRSRSSFCSELQLLQSSANTQGPQDLE